MVGIVGLVALLVALGLSLFVTRLATVALRLTGLSHEAARFQARSAFTGTGFTTSEAESVVDHPVRRRIIMWLMLTRSAGLVTIVISLILAFVGTAGQSDRLIRLAWFLGVMAAIAMLAKSKLADRYITRLMERALRRWTDLDTHDYAALLDLSGDYSVMEIVIRDGDWLEGKTLQSCELDEEGVSVLGVYRDDGTYVGVPKGSTKIFAGDTLIFYGRSKDLKEVQKRRADWAGEHAHQKAVANETRRMQRQDAQERAHERKKERKTDSVNTR